MKKNLSPCIDYLYRISSTKQTSGDNATTHVYGIFPCLSIERLQNIFLSLGQVGSLRYRYRSYFISLFCARALLCFILYIKGNQDKAIVHITFLLFFPCALVFIKSKENKVTVHIKKNFAHARTLVCFTFPWILKNQLWYYTSAYIQIFFTMVMWPQLLKPT